MGTERTLLVQFFEERLNHQRTCTQDKHKGLGLRNYSAKGPFLLTAQGCGAALIVFWLIVPNTLRLCPIPSCNTPPVIDQQIATSVLGFKLSDCRDIEPSGETNE